MKASAAEMGRFISDGELAIPAFVDPDGSAAQRNQELLAAHQAAARHNGEISREDNPDDWVDPIVGRKVFENWMRSVEAVPMLEELEATGKLDPSKVERRPDWLDEATAHEVLRAVAESMLGGESEIETVHPRTRVQYQISAEELPGRRLAIANAKPEETPVGDGVVISKRAFVYDPVKERFVTHVIFRRVGPGMQESRLDLGFRSEIQRREHRARLAKLVKCIHDLAESDIVLPQRDPGAEIEDSITAAGAA